MLAEAKVRKEIITSLNLSIASGAFASAGIDLGKMTACGIILPATITNTSFEIHVSDSLSGTYVPLYKLGSNVVYQVAANKYVPFSPTDFVGIRFMKLVSPTSTTETGARTIKVLGIPLA